MALLRNHQTKSHRKDCYRLERKINADARPLFPVTDAGSGGQTPEAVVPASNGHLRGSADRPAFVTAAAVPPPSDDDLFDPDRLRLSQDFAAAVGVRRLLTTV